MRKRIVFVLCFIITVSVKSQNNTFPTTGNVGIWTLSPKHRLDIYTGQGNLKTFAYGLEYTVNTTGGWARAFRFRNENGNVSASFGSLHGDAYIATGFNIDDDPTGYMSRKLIISSTGNVGIGTNSSSTWKLAVNGKIRAKEVKVETSWSDFVFDKDYDLPTLVEVEKHINEKGHLKDIPSAKEVEENGIYLGEMDAKLLQKIEELTLYIIEQNKRIKVLEAKLDNNNDDE